MAKARAMVAAFGRRASPLVTCTPPVIVHAPCPRARPLATFTAPVHLRMHAPWPRAHPLATSTPLCHVHGPCLLAHARSLATCTNPGHMHTSRLHTETPCPRACGQVRSLSTCKHTPNPNPASIVCVHSVVVLLRRTAWLAGVQMCACICRMSTCMVQLRLCCVFRNGRCVCLCVCVCVCNQPRCARFSLGKCLVVIYYHDIAVSLSLRLSLSPSLSVVLFLGLSLSLSLLLPLCLCLSLLQ